MLITKIYKKGLGKINEDAYTINKQANLYAVMDGATGLDGIPGHIASYAVAKEFEQNNNSLPLLDRLKHANKQVKKENVKYASTYILKDLPKHFHQINKAQRSSTGIAAIQLNETETFFDYVHAGDCMIFLQYKNGDIRTLTHDHIHAFDHRVLQVIQQFQQNPSNQPISFDEMRLKTLPLLIENRAKLNTIDGYGIIDGSEEAIQYLECGKVLLHNVAQVLLLSDGLQIPTTETEENPWELAAKVAFEEGLFALLDIVNEKEHADPHGVRYPRFKFADDKTALLLTFS